MAARAYWQGQIRLALVSIPVEVYPATKSGAAISFRQIHEPSGKRIAYEKIVPGIGPVDRDEIARGYEISRGNYVLLEDDEIEAVKIESKRTLELVQIKDMTAYVRLASGGDGVVPRWQGGRMPLSTELGREVETLLSAHPDASLTSDIPAELRALAPLLALQSRLSSRPRPQHLLAEWFEARDGQHLCVFPFAGRGVHEGIAALMALRWGRFAPNTFSYAANDYGLILSAQAKTSIDAALLRTLLSPDALLDDLRESVNLGELARRQFREVARVAGLLPPSLPGRAARSLRQLQASSGLLFDVLTRYDPDHLLLQQAEREVLAQQLDVPRLETALRDCAARAVDLQRPPSFTPLSFPLWAEALRGQLSTEDWKTRIQRAATQLEKKHG